MKKEYCYKFFLSYKKWVKQLIIKKNRETILNRAKDYYENNNKVLRDKAINKYRELSEEEKNIKTEYGRNRYHNMSKENKQRLTEYQKKYPEANKSKKSLIY